MSGAEGTGGGGAQDVEGAQGAAATPETAQDAPGRTPAVSVVIPTYRRAGSITAAVRSVLRQTWTDFELIVVDDGSGDGTLEALAAIDDPRLKVLEHETNRGANAARNTGLRAARADWVAFQDSDDEWLPEKLEAQLRRIGHGGPEAEAWIGVYCAMLQVDRRPDGRIETAWLPRPAARREPDLADELLRGNMISTQVLLARRAKLIEAGLFDEDLGKMQDWDMALRFAPLGRIAYVDRPLAIQLLSEDSLTRMRDRRQRAYAQVLSRHAARFAQDPAALAEHRYRLALGAAGLGRRGEALGWAWRALAARPFEARWWVRIGRALLRGGAS
ncbi:MAG: glycosyltransferase family 2 protein [Pseudomonadota bacterium]